MYTHYGPGLLSLGVPGVPWLADQLTRGDRLCPPHYYWHPHIFRPSDGPDWDLSSGRKELHRGGRYFASIAPLTTLLSYKMILTRCAPPRWRDALAELNEVQQILRSIVYKTNLSTILVLEKIALK